MVERVERDRFVIELADQLTMLDEGAWEPDFGEGVFAYLDGLTGRRISLHFNWDGSRVEFSGSYPRSLHSGEEFGLDYGETHRVGCSVARGAATVAKDVARRFLPHYEKVWRRGLERYGQHLVQVDAVCDALSRLEEAWGCEGTWHKHHPTEAHLTTYRGGAGGSIKLRVSSSREPEPHAYVIEFNVSGELPVEHAAQVGLLLREMAEVEHVPPSVPVDNDGPSDVLDGAVDAALSIIDAWLFDPQPSDGYTRAEMLDTVRDLLRSLVLTGHEMAQVEQKQAKGARRLSELVVR